MRYLLLLLAVLCLRCAQNNDGKTTAASGTPDSTTIQRPATPNALVGLPDYDTTEWAELTQLDPTIRLDLRYATDNNFVKAQIYDCGRCFLRPSVARAVVAAHRQLQKQGLGLKMFDCYRPRPVQWKLWKMVPDPRYVADPRKGSMHNRGAAADLTVVDSTGRELDMGTGFDFFGEKAYHDFHGLPDNVLKNRQLLLNTMEQHGFRHIRTEWWHYSFQPETFPIADWVWPCGDERH
ncbi:MAG: D-alanyl-D-alanine dipeptidase [Saprospiraceae bacterium]